MNDLIDHCGSQRLARIINVLRDKGRDIVTEMRTNASGRGRHGAYRLFTTPEERAEYDAEIAQRKAMQQRLEAEAAQRKEHARQAKARPMARAAHRSSGTSSYGRHVAGPESQSIRQRSGGSGSVFQSDRKPASPWGSQQHKLDVGARPVRAPSAPPSHVAERIASLSKRPPLKDVSEPGVPVEELNTTFPGAKSREVFEYHGAQYQRRFIPAEKVRAGDKIKDWNVAWVRQ